MNISHHRRYKGYDIYQAGDCQFYQVGITNDHQLLTFHYLTSAKRYIDTVTSAYDKCVERTEAISIESISSLGIVKH